MTADIQTFAELESEARSYCRKFPVVFEKAVGSLMYDQSGAAYIDFLSCAGAVNYGHNHPVLKQALCDYLLADGIQAALDFHTHAKLSFLTAFRDTILKPRKLDYRLQFTGPTGTSVVESAIKLARKVTGRNNVVAFTNGYHGMSGTSLGLTGNSYHRQRVQDPYVTRIAFDGYMEQGANGLALFEKMLADKSSGLDLPAAVIVETVQGEGGVNIASREWLVRLRELTRRYDILLIVDDIQAGCGRTGTFFSFEAAGIVPDLVCLSKSLSGYGLPMSVLLIAPRYDQWAPAEDNGTFRGNTMAFVTAAAALHEFWSTPALEQHIAQAEQRVLASLAALADERPDLIRAMRGRGLFYGLEFHDPDTAAAVATACFRNGLIIERCGSEDQVIKLFPALNISLELLQRGLDVLSTAVLACASPGAKGALRELLYA